MKIVANQFGIDIIADDGTHLYSLEKDFSVADEGTHHNLPDCPTLIDAECEELAHPTSELFGKLIAFALNKLEGTYEVVGPNWELSPAIQASLKSLGKKGGV